MKRFCMIFLVLTFIFSFVPKGFTASDEEIQTLKLQVRELMKRIEKLEVEQVESKAEVVKAREDMAKAKEDVSKAKDTVSRIDLSNALSKLKLKGRWAAGYLASGKAGSYPDGSMEIPDGKIQFSFEPDKFNTVVMRFNVNNATAQSPLMDYFYLLSKDFIPALKDSPYTLKTRLGRFKLGFGEETWSDNPIEGILPSNSAGKVGVTDEGLEVAGTIGVGKIFKKHPLGVVISVSNGNSGVGSDSGAARGLLTKLNYSPIDPLYLSASYYTSGDLKTSASEFSIAGLTSRPAGSVNWKRRAWELDARYDFGKGKKPLDPPAFSDSKAIARISYGQFVDETTTGSVGNRNGNFGFVDGIYNFNKKIYGASRISFVDLDGDATAALNGVTTNFYERFSWGLGYRWSDNTILKLSYDLNKNTGVSTEDADDNLLSALVTTQF